MSQESDAGGAGSEPAPEEDALDEALAIVRGASERGIPVRLVGGLAVRVLCPDFPPRVRDAQDLDFASVSRATAALTAFLDERGYVPDKTFNALYGRKQLYFAHGESGRALDVIVDSLEMCHTLEFKDRIERLPYTLDPVDLLLSKLQIFELNDKDAQDVVYLLSAYAIGESDEAGAIDVRIFRQIVGEDWGWWRTVTMNLDRIANLLEVDRERLVPTTATIDPVEQLKALQQAAQDAPKSMRWKMRARLGDRKRWYQLPEETEHH
ncbi:MAG: hypothetical protein M3P43_02935 [Actinomycetota bacterium]|nr:hypothetical protein [Actinomycetota bacterium]